MSNSQAITPDTLRKARGGKLIFPSFSLFELQRLCHLLEIPRGTATRICHTLGIPLMHIGAQVYYNEFTLERILFALTMVGAKGFAAPGSIYKASGKKGLPTEVTPEMKEYFESPAVLIEMVGAQGRNTGAASKVGELIKKFEVKKDIATSITPQKVEGE